MHAHQNKVAENPREIKHFIVPPKTFSAKYILKTSVELEGQIR